MRVKVRFVPRRVAEYFDSKEVDVIELPEGSRYCDLIEFLERRFRGSPEESILDSFAFICRGVPVLRKLHEPINPGEEILVVTMAIGG